MKKLFILHGWAVRSLGMNKEKWQPFIDLVQSKDTEVVFLAIPGLSAPLDQVWDLSNFVSWLEQEIQQQTKPKEKIFLLGHSFGGQIAIRYAAENATKVEKLILIDSAGIRDMAPKAVLKRTVFLLLSKVGKLLFTANFLRNLLYKIARESDYKNAPPLLRRTMSKILDDEIIGFLPKIKAETKILWGEHDLVTPVKHARQMQALIQNSELSFIEEARHSPQFTHYQETAQLVKEFIKR